MFSSLTELLVAHKAPQKYWTRKVAKRSKLFYFCFVFFCFFRWASPKLRESIMTVFAQNSLHWAVYDPIAFSRFDKVFVTTHSITVASFEALFSRICKNGHMATKLWTGTSSGECCLICFKFNQHLGTKKKYQQVLKM